MTKKEMEVLHFNTEVADALGSILKEAHKIINGNRQNEYGSPEDSFTAIAGYWDWYLRNKLNGPAIEHITPKDVAAMMTLLKLAREEHAHKQDNLIDACGYLAILDHMYEQGSTTVINEKRYDSDGNKMPPHEAFEMLKEDYRKGNTLTSTYTKG